jgi:hypothetical protein
MKKSSFYFSISQKLFAAGMLCAPFIAKYPLTIVISTLMLLIASEQMITYKQLYVIENKVLESEAKSIIRKQKLVVRIMQVCILITAALLANQTFYKIKF